MPLPPPMAPHLTGADKVSPYLQHSAAATARPAIEATVTPVALTAAGRPYGAARPGGAKHEKVFGHGRFFFKDRNRRYIGKLLRIV